MTAKATKPAKKTTRITEPAEDKADAATPAPEAQNPLETATHALADALGVRLDEVVGIDIRENVIRIHGKDRSARSIKRSAK